MVIREKQFMVIREKQLMPIREKQFMVIREKQFMVIREKQFMVIREEQFMVNLKSHPVFQFRTSNRRPQNDRAYRFVSPMRQKCLTRETKQSHLWDTPTSQYVQPPTYRHEVRNVRTWFSKAPYTSILSFRRYAIIHLTTLKRYQHPFFCKKASHPSPIPHQKPHPQKPLSMRLLGKRWGMWRFFPENV